MRILKEFKKTRSRVAFTQQEQAITSLSIALNYLGYEITPAALRNGRSIQDHGLEELGEIARQIGFRWRLDTTRAWVEKTEINDVVIARVKGQGTVVVQKIKDGGVLINNPLGKQIRYRKGSLDNLLETSSCLVISNPKGLNRNEFKRMGGIALSDKRFRNISAAVLLLASLHGLVSLIDPVIKNMYFSNVVQLGIIDWARTLAISYVLIAGLAGVLLIMAALLGYLFTSRLALLWSYSVFSATLRLPDSYLKSRTRGDLLSRVRGSEALASFFGTEEVHLIGGLINALIMLLVLASTSSLMTVLYCLFTAIGILFLIETNQGWKERADKLQQDQAIEVGSFVRLIESVNSLQYERRIKAGFRVHQMYIGNRIRSQQRMSIYSIFVKFGSDGIDTAQSVILLTTAAILIMNGKISLGEYVGFSAILSQLLRPFKRLSSFISKYQSINALLDRVTDVIDEASNGKHLGITQASDDSLIEITVDQLDSKGNRKGFRIGMETVACKLIASSKEKVERWESYLSADEWIPKGMSISMHCENGRRQVLVVRSELCTFAGTVRENIEVGRTRMGTKLISEFNEMLERWGLGNVLEKPIEEIATDRRVMTQVGFARVIWQMPKGIICPTLSEEDRDAYIVASEDPLIKEQGIRMMELVCSEESIVNTGCIVDLKTLESYLEGIRDDSSEKGGRR